MDFVDPGVTNVQEEVFSAILDKFRTKVYSHPSFSA